MSRSAAGLILSEPGRKTSRVSGHGAHRPVRAPARRGTGRSRARLGSATCDPSSWSCDAARRRWALAWGGLGLVCPALLTGAILVTGLRKRARATGDVSEWREDAEQGFRRDDPGGGALGCGPFRSSA